MIQTVTVQIKDSNALKALKSMEQKHSIKIIDSIKLDTPPLKENR